jgi:predicted RNA binding protein YcfA (HicA-like mRNA interferase family)
MPRRLPRDISGNDLISKLKVYGYLPTRQTGSHARLTRSAADGDQHITVSQHKSLRVGTLNAILNDVAGHVGKQKEEVVEELFG